MAVTPESPWAAVDTAADVDRMILGLDRVRGDAFFVRSKVLMHALVPSGEDVRLVDVGCGTGEDTAAIASSVSAAVGVERSRRMSAEARRRHPDLAIVTGDARQLPFPDACFDVVRADRVVQHLDHGAAALHEWRRVLRPGGIVITFDPDVTMARVEGVDAALAARVLAWRAETRAGATTVSTIGDVLGGAGFGDVQIERHVLEASSLEQFDGILGLVEWGDQAALADALTADEARVWREHVQAANGDGSLRFRCPYLLCVGHVELSRPA